MSFELDEKSIGLEWFSENTWPIYCALDKIHRRMTSSIAIEYGIDPKPDRALSESYLCAALRDLYLPRGYRLVNDGHVKSTSDKNVSSPHLYCATSNAIVLCITFGQFIQPSNYQLVPMDRIKYVAGIMPESVRIQRELGIAVLVDTRDTIEEKLGLIYC